MAKGHSIIAPFPGNIDRSRFADVISGFTGGEGHFALVWDNRPHRQTGTAWFTICLREDDWRTLELIQSYFRCGRLFREQMVKKKGHPQLRFTVARSDDLARIIVPHFDENPMYCKKDRDFSIWRLGVEMVYRIKSIGKIRNTTMGGFHSNWTESDKREFRKLADALKECRRFTDDRNAEFQVPEVSNLSTTPSLIDWLEAI